MLSRTLERARTSQNIEVASSWAAARRGGRRSRFSCGLARPLAEDELDGVDGVAAHRAARREGIGQQLGAVEQLAVDVLLVLDGRRVGDVAAVEEELGLVPELAPVVVVGAQRLDLGL